MGRVSEINYIQGGGPPAAAVVRNRHTNKQTDYVIYVYMITKYCYRLREYSNGGSEFELHHFPRTDR